MNNLPERMTKVRLERLSLRRKMFKFLRENRHLIKDRRLIRKMDSNWMSDLSDLSLIAHTKKLMEKMHYEI